MSVRTIPQFPQSPQFPGLKAVAVFNPDLIPEASRILAGYGLPLSLPEQIDWLAIDDVPAIKYSSEIKNNVPVRQTVLTFSTRDTVPGRSAFVAVDADGTAWAVGFSLYHPGTLKASASTSSPKGDPVTVTYEFTSPYPPAKVILKD